MSLTEMTSANGQNFHESPQDAAETVSPFGPSPLFTQENPTELASEYAAGGGAMSPFSEALASYSESELEMEAFDALLAELEDEDFTEAVQALTDEAAARHLRATA